MPTDQPTQGCSSRHSSRYFVTGTDTDAGKTLISSALLAYGQQKGLSTFGLKPVAAGCELNDNQQWINEDALLHQTLSFPPHDYALHNPVALQAAIAPHIAAEQEARPLQLSELASQCLHSLNSSQAELQIIEGAGGWLVPLNNNNSMADLAVELSKDGPMEVILVVGLKLGCINHALLTLESIQQRGLKLAGWVANSLSPDMEVEADNLNYLTNQFEQQGIARLGHVPFIADLADLRQPATESEQSLAIKISAARSASRYLQI
ncbi:MAG: dethiobiotin synthase [Oceanobacter sp.]